jgi:hypothetical protein
MVAAVPHATPVCAMSRNDFFLTQRPHHAGNHAVAGAHRAPFGNRQVPGMCSNPSFVTSRAPCGPSDTTTTSHFPCRMISSAASSTSIHFQVFAHRQARSVLSRLGFSRNTVLRLQQPGGRRPRCRVSGVRRFCLANMRLLFRNNVSGRAGRQAAAGY